MKAKTSIKKGSGTRLPKRIRKVDLKPVCLQRRSASEFTCGIEMNARFLLRNRWLKENGEADEYC
jgi:hypothetical protein